LNWGGAAAATQPRKIRIYWKISFRRPKNPFFFFSGSGCAAEGGVMGMLRGAGAPWAAGSLPALEAKAASAMTRYAVTAKRAGKDGMEGVFSLILGRDSPAGEMRQMDDR